MAHLTRRRFLGVLPGFVAVAVGELRTAQARRRFGRVRWPTGKKIIVENQLGPEWNEAVEFEAAQWHRALPRLRFKVEHRNGGCRWRDGRIVICPGPIIDQTIGRTWLDADPFTRTIYAAKIQVAMISWPDMWNEHLSTLDVSVLCHEFGHALGLSHVHQSQNSCMTPGVIRTTPTAFDRESLRLLYSRRGPRWP